jgi:hypothetical protein
MTDNLSMLGTEGCYNPLSIATDLLKSCRTRRRGLMSDQSRYTVLCPCCEASLIIDSQTGAIISHEEKAKPVGSFDDMLKGLGKQKQMREQIFEQELGSLKDRERLLDEKFREALKRADKDKDKPYRNPLDVD